MVFKNFRLQIILRLFFLCILLFFSFYIWFNSEFKGFSALLAVIFIWQVYSLLKLIDTTNYELARFFEAVKYSDFTRSFSAKMKGKSYTELYKALNDVMDHIEQSRAEKEEQYRYLQTIVQHIGIGLIVFDGSGNVDLVNNAARRILNTSTLRNISKLETIEPSLVERITSLKHLELPLTSCPSSTSFRPAIRRRASPMWTTTPSSGAWTRAASLEASGRSR